MDYLGIPQRSPGLDILSTFSGSTGVWSLLAKLFNRKNIWESAKLLLVGSIIESGRRLYQWLSARLHLHYGVSASFKQGDPAYDWLMLFLTETDAWKKSTAFKVTAKSAQRKWTAHEGAFVLAGNADYVPSFEEPLLFRWNGYWVDVSKSTSMLGQLPYVPQVPKGAIHVTIFTRNLKALSDLVEEARLRYQENGRPRVTVHLNDAAMMGPRGTEWNMVKTKHRRPLNTLALEDGVLESILEDAREFLKADDWYTEVGIPHRRGYLLYGPPGTGKTSTIYAIAGELGLELYSLSLASRHIDDSFLQRLVSSVPRNSILLIEDIDCAFPSRDDEDDDKDVRQDMMMPSYMRSARMRGQASVTMSGILNVLDGVGSDEGRIFFATTNHVDRLDAALLRPGRIDRKIEYQLSTRRQALSLFERFFPASRFNPADATSGKSEKYDDLEALGAEFASSIPEHEFSTAEIQGYLLSCKSRPAQAAAGAKAWVERQRADRLAKEERERERKAAKEAKAAQKGGAQTSAATSTPSRMLGMSVMNMRAPDGPAIGAPILLSSRTQAPSLPNIEVSQSLEPVAAVRSTDTKQPGASGFGAHELKESTPTLVDNTGREYAPPSTPSSPLVPGPSPLAFEFSDLPPAICETQEESISEQPDDFSPLSGQTVPLPALLQPTNPGHEATRSYSVSPTPSESSSGVLVDAPSSIEPSPNPSTSQPGSNRSEPDTSTELSTSSRASVGSESSTSSIKRGNRLSTPSRGPYVRPSTPSRGIPRPSTPSRGTASSTARKASGTKIPIPDHLVHPPARPRSPMLPPNGQRTRTTSHTSTSQGSISSGTARPRLPSGWRPQSPSSTV
ncbi:P-loop containing nucleoside triphosphate hydrolase protein [Punctularia strigosozonata HHB-11173 SS5]|uniref:P-loop containing nucleoside triphosphate hydrolase protein n=1 Tax=Punctularia strigosozonata (strain HHB-11173) TaxID=741275 RepID=UPI0004416D84|nr:P-loop containing nucleoside triphosphate hydrolase protein [Punctularia strigosozonata HHB-11173 SS5]EIN08798.1 P-loop containing nucleoside triphosphate hydrolase protein [Punctularia strigosozonata HHB-11173 SS5]